ncbi:folate-binding protein YgfZ [Ahrensia sp. 13_GOM-1096m]|uniref:CAF17-like 4Fe-4S cluster assembly/insertion protein YgfZ n=1 Tax=Ahrensia sp. 13_GOM-1096m TaxID=1380380 RepID=UPI00047A824E|nr:aminomethyltransferase [Ahrensia sp. 13_GOM-1096m]
MPNVVLDERTLITFDGSDATHLLHNVLTCNIESLNPGIAQIGALLTPQGKIMFDFLISKTGDNVYLVDIETGSAAAFIQRMKMFRLRSKVEITESTESLVSISWDDDSSASSDALRDTRFADMAVYRSYKSGITATDRTEWDALRIEQGVAESGLDFQLGDAFPHDVSLDQNGGVDFKKGCYIGQEVISRMHHRKTARRRILIAKTDTDYGEATDLVANDKPVGSLGTKIGQSALALCRIDRVKDAIDNGHMIKAGDANVELSIPPSVSYSWPSESDKDA